MKNMLFPALGAIILAIACTVQVDEIDEVSRSDSHDRPFETTSNDHRVITPNAFTSVPAELQVLAEALVPAETRHHGYFLHFTSLGTTDEIERFRVSYGLLELRLDELRIGAPAAVTELEFDHHAETATACHTGDCALDSVTADDANLDASAWRPIDALVAQPDVANVVTWVVRFYANTNYGGAMYSLTYDVTNNGLFLLGVPNTTDVNGNDIWSSFRTYDSTCPGCLVNGKEIDVYDVTAYKNTNFVGPMKNYGGIDSDSSFANDTYSGLGGSVDNSISSFKVSLAVFDPPQCGNGVCNGGESYATCPQDCPPPCGDGICQAGESYATCPQDCPPPCPDGICQAGQDYWSCPQDCPPPCGDSICQGTESSWTCPVDCCADIGYQGVCNASGPCCNSDFDCGYGGVCLMIVN